MIMSATNSYPDVAWFKIMLSGRVVARTLTEDGAWQAANTFRDAHPSAPLSIQYPADANRVDLAGRSVSGFGPVTFQVTERAPGAESCCRCCEAADERGELDHLYGNDCPHPRCDYCQGA